MTKREVIEKILVAWEKSDQLRFGQLMINIETFANKDLFYISDNDLIDHMEKFIRAIEKFSIK